MSCRIQTSERSTKGWRFAPKPLGIHHQAQFHPFTAGHWHHGNTPVFTEAKTRDATETLLKEMAGTSSSEGNWLREISNAWEGKELTEGRREGSHCAE